jgi:tRNA-modifying protein YgfZ
LAHPRPLLFKYMLTPSTYAELVAGRAYAVLNGWSVLSVQGTDAGKFLQSFCTNDVLKRAVGESCEAFFTNAKAHVVAYGEVHRGAERWLVLLSSPTAHELAGALDRYIIREDVQLAAPGEEMTLVLTPREATNSLDDALGEQLPLVSWGAEWGVIVSQTRGVSILQSQLQAAGLTRASWEAVNALRIELGAPLDRIDVDESNLPQEVNRNSQAISFTKGCYLGQEPVARIDALGHVNRTLVGVKFSDEGIPSRGAELSRDGKVVGQVTSACWSPRLQSPLALAYVRRGSNDVGSLLESPLGAAEVVELPIETTEKRDVIA